MFSAPYVDIHTHHPREGIVSLASYCLGRDSVAPPHPFSAGIHPWDTGSVAPSAAHEFLTAAKSEAVGETGLDRLKGPGIEVQEQLFRLQLDYASRNDLPVVIHCVKAYERIAAILNEYPLRAVIFHGYTGSPQQTRALQKPNAYFSFGPNAFGSAKTSESFRRLPVNSIFAETDDSGREIAEVYTELAKILAMGIDRLKDEILENYNTIFQR